MTTIYKVCKRTIERDNYPEDMAIRIEVFYKANLINEKEYNKLLTLIK